MPGMSFGAERPNIASRKRKHQYYDRTKEDCRKAAARIDYDEVDGVAIEPSSEGWADRDICLWEQCSRSL